MGFFEQEPPAVPDEPPPRQPEWSAPPENVVGATVPFDLVLANTGDVAVAVGGMTAYPTGVSFTVRVVRREAASDDLFFRLHHPGPGGLRLGVELADGAKVIADRSEPGRGPTLTPRGGGGGGLSFELGFWLWPLPPAGPLRFACAWPDEGIEETTAELEAPIHEAAARAIELWADDRPVS